MKAASLSSSLFVRALWTKNRNAAMIKANIHTITKLCIACMFDLVHILYIGTSLILVAFFSYARPFGGREGTTSRKWLRCLNP